MPPRKKSHVKCLCGCGDYVTRKMEKSHLELKNLKPAPVPDIIRKQCSRPGQAYPRPTLLTPENLRHQLDAEQPSTNWNEPQPPVIDHSELWEHVLASRVHYEPSLSGTGDGSTHTESFLGDFVSEPDSDADAQPEDIPNLQYNPATYGINPELLLREEHIVNAVKNAPKSLTSSHMDDIETFDFIVQENMSVRTYHAMQERFRLKRSHATLPSLKGLRTRILTLSGLKPRDYACCKNSCMCFCGPYSDLDVCSECNTPRNGPTGTPWNIFTSLPFIPQLRSCFSCRPTAEAMLYRDKFPENDDSIRKVFNGKQYRRQRKTYVVVDGITQPYKYYEGEHDVALGLSTDGLCPFKRRKKSCWPIIAINYNLPPEIRTHIENIMCVGVIPGPHSSKNLCSFLWPLIEELLELSRGVTAVDILTGKLFVLHAYLLAVFGNIPAVTKLLEFLGHNGRYPCQFCLIRAIQGVTSGGGTHLYCPLHRPDGSGINPRHLPMHTHEGCLKSGFAVLNAPTETAQSNLATESGIKGVSALARLLSISIPSSFPIDIMHLVWTNLIPQLVRLWTKDFNGLDDGTENYLFDPELWKRIGDITENSGPTIPSSFGCRVPNVTKPTHFIAESWSIFATQLAPSILRRRFRNPKYYTHFVRLINLLNKCTAFSLPRAELPVLREGFIKWVEDFEKIYYQYDAERLQVCPVNVHYVLHIVDSVEEIGPVWCYWAFPMERFCSFIGAAVKSRRRPFANISRRIRDTAQLQIIRNLYSLHEQLQFGRDRVKNQEEIADADRLPDYPRAQLLTPHSDRLNVTPQLQNKIATYLATSFGIRTSDAKTYIPDKLKQWGRVKISDGGDLIHARGYHKLRYDERDSSFVRYELLVDRDAHRPRAPERLERVSHYGQVERLFALPIPPQTPLNTTQQTKTFLLALIREVPFRVESTFEYTVVWYEGSLGTGEIVDAQTIQCAVGRIPDGKRYWIVDRSSDCEENFPMFH